MAKFVMDESFRKCMRKLALWHTRTFKPIMTHDELDPIMSTLGFVGQPPKPSLSGAVWKEYVYAAGGWLTSSPSPLDDSVSPPRPRLPFQRINGPHIRGLPLHRVYDMKKRFQQMEAEENIFVYTEGTLEPSTYNLYHVDKNTTVTYDNNKDSDYTSIVIQRKDNTASVGPIVALKDIIV